MASIDSVTGITKSITENLADRLGPELFVNGKFVDGVNGWSTVGSFTESGNEGVLDGTGGLAFAFQGVVTQNLNYELTFDVIALTGAASIINNDGTTILNISGTGPHSVQFTHAIANSNLIFRCLSGSNILTFDNASVRQILSTI